MKLTEKAKKRLALAGLGIVCVILVIAITSQFKAEIPKETEVQPSTAVTISETPSVSIHTETEAPTSVPEVSVQPITPTESASQTTDTGDSNGTEQSIQAEVTKPAEPSEEAKTNPKKTPDGQTVTKSDDNTSSSNSSEPSSSSSTPKSGDKKDGKIYVPGFGWVEDNGGGGSGSTVGNTDDELTGNKVGSMD